ncbi:hypothetical protein EV426DRAFT_601530, partial [Tirmania nivea]
MQVPRRGACIPVTGEVGGLSDPAARRSHLLPLKQILSTIAGTYDVSLASRRKSSNSPPFVESRYRTACRLIGIMFDVTVVVVCALIRLVLGARLGWAGLGEIYITPLPGRRASEARRDPYIVTLHTSNLASQPPDNNAAPTHHHYRRPPPPPPPPPQPPLLHARAHHHAAPAQGLHHPALAEAHRQSHRPRRLRRRAEGHRGRRVPRLCRALRHIRRQAQVLPPLLLLVLLARSASRLRHVRRAGPPHRLNLRSNPRHCPQPCRAGSHRRSQRGRRPCEGDPGGGEENCQGGERENEQSSVRLCECVGFFFIFKKEGFWIEEALRFFII